MSTALLLCQSHARLPPLLFPLNECQQICLDHLRSKLVSRVIRFKEIGSIINIIRLCLCIDGGSQRSRDRPGVANDILHAGMQPGPLEDGRDDKKFLDNISVSDGVMTLPQIAASNWLSSARAVAILWFTSHTCRVALKRTAVLFVFTLSCHKVGYCRLMMTFCLIYLSISWW